MPAAYLPRMAKNSSERRDDSRAPADSSRPGPDASKHANAAPSPSTPSKPHPLVSLADARRVIAAAERAALSQGQPMNIAVVDAGGNLVAHIRMDGAWMGSINIAINKAWTSRAFDISTKELAGVSQPGEDFFGIHASNQGRVTIFAGGVPLKRAGNVVGAVGVSGGSGKQDHAVAKAGAAAF
ncbi:hypothetical protein BH11PLA1_BH11PLA1_20620 [soil metagenome]